MLAGMAGGVVDGWGNVVLGDDVGIDSNGMLVSTGGGDGLNVQLTGIGGGGGVVQSTLQIMLLKAKDVADRLLMDFTKVGEIDPNANAVEVLKTSLAMLGHPCESSVRGSSEENPLQGIGGPHFSAPTMLAHPDEFKNPSSFLKIYGDPLCGSLGGNNPVKGQNGNWVCAKCQNVNFPRRFRCNKCSEYRDGEGDDIVSEYAKTVYHQHLRTYKALAAKSGVEIPLKRFTNPTSAALSPSQCQPMSTPTTASSMRTPNASMNVSSPTSPPLPSASPFAPQHQQHQSTTTSPSGSTGNNAANASIDVEVLGFGTASEAFPPLTDQLMSAGEMPNRLMDVTNTSAAGVSGGGVFGGVSGKFADVMVAPVEQGGVVGGGGGGGARQN
eukprot:GHVS01009391.1.p1 GENE.GHVS01009391.1~~GHVS01009391.1.p1  ORF type:complete len:384 (+),score=91.84 GHVS01009391.1:937-2088(+)